MGCFAFRCAVSGLPIHYGTKVRFMLVTENPVPPDFVTRSSTCAFWHPRSIPILAEYNDYGEVENVEQGVGFDLMLEGLRRELVERPVGENEYHDVPVRLDMGWEDIMTALWKDRVQVKIEPMIRSISRRRFDRQGEEALAQTPPEVTKVSYCMIRDDVWRRLLRLSSRNTFSDEELRVSDFRREAYALYKKAPIDMKGAWEKVGTDKDFLAFEEAMDEFRSPLAKLGLHDEYVFGIVGHWKLLRERKLPFKEVRPVLNSLAEFAHIYMMLRHFGHQWLPSNTYGQQHGDFGSHGKFLSAMGSVAAKVQREWDEEYGEADDEEGDDSDV